MEDATGDTALIEPLPQGVEIAPNVTTTVEDKPATDGELINKNSDKDGKVASNPDQIQVKESESLKTMTTVEEKHTTDSDLMKENSDEDGKIVPSPDQIQVKDSESLKTMTTVEDKHTTDCDLIIDNSDVDGKIVPSPDQIQVKDSELSKSLTTVEDIQATDSDLINKNSGEDGKIAPCPDQIQAEESESLKKMRAELEKMRLEDDHREEIAAAKYKEDFRKERNKIEDEVKAQGYMFNPDIRDIKSAIADIMKEERVCMLQRQLDALDREEKEMQKEIDEKYGLLFSPDSRHDLTALADKFFSLPGNAGLPEHITRSLTSEEIADLKIVFDMFDVKGRGFVSSNDLKKALAMLGFKASKAVLGNMISEVAGDNKVKVTFENFLDFVVKSQGDGPDPYGEIKQAFELLDTQGNGFLTLDDLRDASSECNLHFSNNTLREMIQDADKHGEGKISLADFTDMMLQTSRFKYAS